MVFDKNLEVVTLLKKVLGPDDKFLFVPYKVIEGFYVAEDGAFYDLDGTPYYHLIEDPDTLAFFNRKSLSSIFPEKNDLKKREVFKSILDESKGKFFFSISECNVNINLPLIVYYDKDSYKIFIDNDLEEFYNNYYKDEYKLIKGKNNIDLKVFSDNNDKIDEIKEDTSLETSDIENNDEDEYNFNIDVCDIFNKITEVVIDQDEPIKKILTAIWKQNSNFSLKSRNILINGGTGVGKTEIFRILSKIIEVPCVITSATQYSATGYKGCDVEDMLISLVNRANGDLKKAEKGILIIDEVDKISEIGDGDSHVNQRSVQEALLKILEDGVLPIETKYGYLDFDTSKLMVIAMGSWTCAKVNEQRSVGFNSKEVVKKNYKTLTREDMIKNGLIPDFVGRFNTIVQMNDLKYESLLRILKESKNNLLLLNKEFLKNKGVTLTIKDDAYEEIAKKAEKSNFGARELDSIIETALFKASYEIASNPDKYGELIIDKNIVIDNSNYKLVLKNKIDK